MINEGFIVKDEVVKKSENENNSDDLNFENSAPNTSQNWVYSEPFL